MKYPVKLDKAHGLERASFDYMATGHSVIVFADEYMMVLDGGPKITYQQAYKIMTETLSADYV